MKLHFLLFLRGKKQIIKINWCKKWKSNRRCHFYRNPVLNAGVLFANIGSKDIRHADISPPCAIKNHKLALKQGGRTKQGLRFENTGLPYNENNTGYGSHSLCCGRGFYSLPNLTIANGVDTL